MKYRRTVGGIAALATVASASALVAFSSPSYAGSTTDLSFLGQTVGGLEKTANGAVEQLMGSNGDVSVVKAKGAPIALPKGAPAPRSAAEAAKIQLDKFGAPFAVTSKDVKVVSSTKVADGNVVKFQQYKNGLPVFAGEVVASMDKKGGLEALLGGTVKGTVESVTSGVAKLKAAGKAKEYVAKKADSKALLQVEDKGKWIYNPSSLGAPGPNVNREVHRFIVKDQQDTVNWTVLVDRVFGAVALGYDNHHHAVNRKICNNANQAHQTLDENKCDGTTKKYVRSEGGAAVGDEEVDDVYKQLGDTAKIYASYGGIDLTNLIGTGTDGKALRATVRICATQVQSDCPMSNAFWSGGAGQMFFGENFDLLDVTAHEVTHGVTEKTSVLEYAYQSGAINESMSDVFGEIVDLATNPSKVGTAAAWKMGDEFEQDGFVRDMADPTKSDQPQADRMTSKLWYNDVEWQDNGGVHFNSGPGNKAGFLLGTAATTSFNGYSIRGIGLQKAFKVYWAAQNLLTSGSDYKDLFYTLPLACKKLIGKPGQITADDCAQVDKTVRATEMYKNAASAAPVATPYCTEAQNVKASYSQGFDGPKRPSDWTFSQYGMLSLKEGGYDYVNRGADSALMFTQVAGQDPAVTSASLTSKAKTIPAGSQLRFDYVSFFGWNAKDGLTRARLEYKVGSGAWQKAETIPGATNGGIWRGHSYGWSSAKYPLSSFAGKSVAFRFLLNDPPNQDAGISTFNVDNFKIYTCAGK